MAHFVILSTCGTGDGIRTRKFDVIAPTDFKSVFCSSSNTPACGCEHTIRTSSLAYEASELPLLHHRNIGAVLSLTPGLRLDDRNILRDRIS